MDIQTDGIKRKRFLWGVGLAWTPFLFLIIPLFSAFCGIAREKATGMAVLGGALVEFFSTFGLAATLVFEVAAIILLLRTFSGGRPGGAPFSVMCICCCGFIPHVLVLFL